MSPALLARSNVEYPSTRPRAEAFAQRRPVRSSANDSTLMNTIRVTQTLVVKSAEGWTELITNAGNIEIANNARLAADRLDSLLTSKYNRPEPQAYTATIDARPTSSLGP